MKAPWSGKLSAAKTGWLIALLFLGWLAFFLLPAPGPEPELPPPYVKPPPSRIVALGLPDNPDLEHLPEYFALYADKAEWENDKTIFAYWNPGSNSYSYFIEAVRENGQYKFRLISKVEAYSHLTHEEYVEYFGDDDSPTAAEITAIAPIVESPIHPMVLFHSFDLLHISTYKSGFRRLSVPFPSNKVQLDLKVNPQPLPKIEFKDLLIHNEPTKK